jgi:ribonuclease HI
MTTYVNSDASYELGVAALAYDSETLGREVVIVNAKCSTEAEFLALRMAMRAAAAAHLHQVTFRVDSTTLVRPAKVTKHRLLRLCQEIIDFTTNNEEWTVVHVPRRRNVQANVLARRALRAHQPKPYERDRIL